MSEHANGNNWFETLWMYACFGLAIVSASVVAIVLRIDGFESPHSLSIAGVGLSTTGVWFALGIFLYQDRKRKKTDDCIKAELSEIRDELAKLRCKCQVDCCGEAVGQEPKGRSRLFGLLCGVARE